MPVAITLHPASDVPIFRQIVRQIQQAIFAGKLQRGEQLPSVRALAETLVVNPNTVAKAYQELVASGLVESRSGRGIYVTAKRQVFSKQEEKRRLSQAAQQLCAEAQLFDLSLERLQKLLAAEWRELQAPTDSTKGPRHE